MSSLIGVWGHKNFEWVNIDPEVNIVVGINGSGKTTLLNLIFAELEADTAFIKKYKLRDLKLEYYGGLLPNDFYFIRSFDNPSNDKRKNESRLQQERRREEIFYYKRKEWENEQEFRVIRRAKKETDDEYLDIANALVCAIICKDDSIEKLESMFYSNNYRKLRFLNKKLPVLTYECDLDGYTLYESWGVPMWSEQCGEM